MSHPRIICARAIVAVCFLLAGASCGGPAPPTSNQLSLGHDILLPPDTVSVRDVVPRNATLAMLLRAQGVAADATARVVAAAAEVFDPRRLRASQPFMLARTLEGALRHFEYEIDADRLLRIIPAGIGVETLHAEVLPIPKTLEQAAIAGAIDEETPSLYQAMDAAGERPELSIALARVFSGEIDFNTELQPADRFAVSFERFTRANGPSTYGEITAAEFSTGGRSVRAIRFTPPDGQTDYYDENGRSLRRFFLRSPLRFEPRITSRFSRGRMHPVLHVSRAHRGVDYGAPAGSPVVAVASGTVVSATYDGTNGRMVRLRHSGGYESYYLHLSAFASGVHAGTRVPQSDVIGYVGATGLATGPHLHYGLRKNGVFVNPLVEHRNMPPGAPVPDAAMEAFCTVRDRSLEQLSAASNSFVR